MKGSLFDRLTNVDMTRIDDDESIRNHLLRLLTARAGSVQCLPDYGLPDLNNLHLSKSELLNEICNSIQGCIVKYEPRLANPKVTVAPISETSTNLIFHIQAQKINRDGTHQDWKWNIALDNNSAKEYV